MTSELDEYFSKFSCSPSPAFGTKPLEAVWKRVGELRVTGNRLYIGDSWSIGGGSVETPITPGTYDVDALCFSYGTDGRVAVLRGRLQGCNPDASREAGDFGVDVASAGVIDADPFDRWAQADEAGYEAWQLRFTEAGSPEIAGFFPCEAIGGAMLFTSTGFGDGAYKAVTLLAGEKPVGFEVRFLEEGQGYFDDTAEQKAEAQRPKTFKEKAQYLAAIPLAAVAIVIGVGFGLLARGLRGISRLFSGRR